MTPMPSSLQDDPVPENVSTPVVAVPVAEAASAPAARKTRAPAKKRPAVAVKAKPAAKKAADVLVAKKAKAAPVAKKAAPTPAKPAKAHKPKLVRDSFTIPKDEYQALDALKARALGLGQHVRKSELLRAGIRALSAMGDAAFLKAVGAVPTLKTGRPKKG